MFYPLIPYARPERAGLLGSVDVEDVQPLAAGADRNAELILRDPAQGLAADPAVADYIPYLAHALDLGVVAEHYIKYRGAAASQAGYLEDLHGRLGVRHLPLTLLPYRRTRSLDQPGNTHELEYYAGQPLAQVFGSPHRRSGPRCLCVEAP